jgi:succinyl-CoA synthetase beta subunit
MAIRRVLSAAPRMAGAAVGPRAPAAMAVAGPQQPKRHLNIHEYQSAALMQEMGVNVPFGLPASTVAEAVAAAETIGDEEVVIKSQILAGGRGLGTFTNGLQGGVHVIKTAEVEEYASKMLGGTLVTKQSGAEGKPVNQLLLAKKMDLVNEMYFAILLDRASGGPVIIACSEGGTSIEDLAESNPEAIVKVPIHPIEVSFLEWSEVSEKDGAADSSGWR